MMDNLSLAAVVALGVATTACVTDVRTRRIPNTLTFSAAALGLSFGAAAYGLDGLRLATGGWLLGTALFLPFFLLRGMGAGDVKLLAALGAWLGPLPVLWVAIYASLAGGVLGLALAISKGYLRTAIANIGAIGWHWVYVGVRPVPGITLDNQTRLRLPYAIPIFIGTVVTLWLR